MKSDHLNHSQQGFSLIELLIVVAIVGILSAIAVPNLLASRRAANESAIIGSLRAITSAQMTYRAIYGADRNYATTGPDLAAVRLIDDVIGAPAPAVKSGYNITITGILASGTTESSYEVTAEPVSFGGSGTRSFYMNETGVIYFRSAAAAGTRAAPGTPLQ